MIFDNMRWRLKSLQLSLIRVDRKMKTEDFIENFENTLMQSVSFSYAGKRYILYGYWAIDMINDDGTETSIDDGNLITKYEALDAKVFNDRTKSLREIIPNLTDVDFDF